MHQIGAQNLPVKPHFPPVFNPTTRCAKNKNQQAVLSS
jgi:hypothetical protein